jgi:hypothetical protein
LLGIKLFENKKARFNFFQEKVNYILLLNIQNANIIKNMFYSIIKKFVHLPKEKSQIFRMRNNKSLSNKINYHSDESFTLQKKENLSINKDKNFQANKEKDTLKFESLWFHIKKAVSNNKNFFDENAIKNIVILLLI